MKLQKDTLTNAMQNEGEFLYAGVAILFEIDDANPNKEFDDLFNKMKLEEDNPSVDVLPFDLAMK